MNPIWDDIITNSVERHYKMKAPIIPKAVKKKPIKAKSRKPKLKRAKGY